MVNWKEIPKIDAHIHLLPEDVIRANRGQGNTFVDYGGVCDYLDIMDENNIECAFVMPFNDPYMLSMDFTIDSVHANMRQIATSAPQRLYCFADIDLRKDMTQTITELEKVLLQREFIGIKLHPTNAGYPIDGAYYDGIFQYADDHGVLIEIHSYPREHLTDDVCAPSRIKNVLNKYPRLNVSIAHLGGFQYAELYGLNGYFNLSGILPDLVNRLGIGEANKVLRSVGVDKLVFATDYPDSRCLKPTEIYQTYFEMLDKMDFTREEAEQICRYNALKMIGIG